MSTYTSIYSPNVSSSTSESKVYIPYLTNEIACFVGHFEKGPINKPIFITSISEFKFIFGRGINEHHNDWYQVYNYLSYASGIYIVRTSGTRAYNSSNKDNLKYNIQSYDEFIEYDNLEDNTIIASTPGTWGDLLSVEIINYNIYNSNSNMYKQYFSYFEEDYYGVIVKRKDKTVQSFYKYKDNIEELNKESFYIYIKTTDISNLLGINNLVNGYVKFPTDEDIQESYDIFASDYYNIDIIIGNELYNQAAINLAENRKDCIAFIGLPTKFIDFLMIYVNNKKEVIETNNKVIVLNQIISPDEVKNDSSFIKEIDKYISSLTKSNYVHFTINVKGQIDGFTDKRKLVNLAGDIAGLKAKASLISPWHPGAGLERGIIKNLSSLYVKLSSELKKKYYKEGINYIENNYILTQKTFTAEQSSYNRISTRSLFNYIEKEVKKILRYYVFEENTLRNRGLIASKIKQFLVKLKTDGGITAAKVYVTAKSEQISEPNSILINIQVKPIQIIEYVSLQMITTLDKIKI